MGLGDAIVVVEKFFLDIIGWLLPGATFLFLASGMVRLTATGATISTPRDIDANSIVIVVGYILGFIVVSMAEHYIVPLLNEAVGRLSHRGTSRSVLWWVIPGLRPDVTLFNEIVKSESYKLAAEKLHLPLGLIHPSGSSDAIKHAVHEARDIAMSAAPDHDQKIYKFMYTSQLCGGVAAAVAVGLPLHAVLASPHVSMLRQVSLWPLVVYVTVVLLLIERRNRFFSIAMRIPFAIVVGNPGETRPPDGEASGSINDPPAVGANSSVTTTPGEAVQAGSIVSKP